MITVPTIPISSLKILFTSSMSESSSSLIRLMCVTLSSCSSLGRSKRWGGGLVKLRRLNEIWSSEVIYEIRRFGIWVNRLRSKVTREERGHRGGLMSHTQGSGLFAGNLRQCCDCDMLWMFSGSGNYSSWFETIYYLLLGRIFIGPSETSVSNQSGEFWE